MMEYEKLDFLGHDIDSVVSSLLRYRQEGKLVSTEFNGVTLYSDTVTLNDAYKAITGKTKEECEIELKNWKENYEKELKTHQDRIPELTEQWIKKGAEILDEDKLELWNKIVPIRLSDLYRGMELGNCLDIVKILKDGGTLDEAKAEMEKQGHSGMSFSLVCAMVKEFSPKGEEFVNYVK